MKTEEYLTLRARLIDLGFEHDIQWAENVGPPASAEDFAIEYAFVVCNSGMKAQIARKIFEKVFGALRAGEHPSTVFGHEGKASAIWEVWNARQDWFARYMSIQDDAAKVKFLQTMPWIGGIIKWHLAKNFGVDAVKPDRHLVRLGTQYGTTPDALCRALANATGDRIGTVDYVLWRACNLGLINPLASAA